MNTQKRKNWSVILLMSIGILFVTIAGSIFVSNTWKLMTETAKEICLAAVTIGIFTGSHLAMKNEKMTITGKALYYLGVLTSGFTSFMLLGLFDDSFLLTSRELGSVKFAISILVMMVEMALIYSKQRNVFDIFVAYVLFNSAVFSGAMGLSFTIEATLIIYAGEVLLLAINDALLNASEDAKVSSKVCGLIFYLITLGNVVTTLFFDCIANMDESNFRYCTVIGGILFFATLVSAVFRKDFLSRALANVLLVIFLCILGHDIKENAYFVQSYYEAEITFLLTVVFIVLTKVFWYDEEKSNAGVDIWTFIVACIAGLAMLSHNVGSEHIECVLTLGLVSLATLIWSSIVNNKKYQILSGVILGLMAIYLTRSFWLSVAWWVYLLIVGIICIVIAVLKEKKAAEDERFAQNFVAEVVDIDITEK